MTDLIENAQTAAEIIMNFKNYCATGQHLIIPEGVTEIGMGAFYRDGSDGYGDSYMLTLTLPSTVKIISYNSFAHNSHLQELIIPHGCEILYSRAFYGCTGLTTLSLPNTLLHVYANCVTPTSKLTTVILEQGFDCNLSSNLPFTNANLSAEVMVNMFNALSDHTGLSSNTLVLGSANLAKLTEEQKAIATNKNWNLA